MATIPTSSIGVRAPASDRKEYGFVFWCFGFFTFILLVAPQGLWNFLQPLHLARVSIILTLAAYVYQRLSNNEPLFQKTPELHHLGWFTFLVVLSIPFSLWPTGSLALLTDLYAKSVIVLLLTAHVLATLARFKRMLWLVLIFCSIVAVMAIMGFQNRAALVEVYRMGGAGGGLTSNPNDFALTINLFLPFGFAFYGLNRNPFSKAFCVLFVFTAIAAIQFTYSRGGFITLVAVLCLCFWKMVGPGKKLKYALLFIVVIAAFGLLAPQDYMERLGAITDFSKDKTGSGDAREIAIHKTVEVILEHPVFGVGMGMNVLALNEKGLIWSSVHNVYLQVASEIGVLGLIVYVLLLISLIKSVRLIQTRFKNTHEQQELVGLAGAVEVSLIAFCVAGLFHPVAYHFYFYFIAGFAMALKTMANCENKIGAHSKLPLGRAEA